jgi:hypothetical protein
MSRRHAALSALCLLFTLAAAAEAMGASKHFRASAEHFNDYAAKAADLYFKTEPAAEKNILSHLTAVCAIYAEKANGLAHMADVAEHMTAKRDAVYVTDRLRGIKATVLSTLPQDIKLLTELVENQENQALRQLGAMVITELRVFERNANNL